MDTTLEVYCNDKWYSFAVRSENPDNPDATDKDIVHEIFGENVYDVNEGDFDDTGIAIDIGGNFGAFTVYAAAMGAKRVYTHEPNSENWDRLMFTLIQDLGDTIVFTSRAGVGAVPGYARLTNQQGESHVTTDDTDAEDITIIPLEVVFADNGISNCDVLKIDCEGSEYDIIAGASPEILAKARYITMEFHATDAIKFGEMIAKLTLTHNVHIIGRYDTGGQIYARLY